MYAAGAGDAVEVEPVENAVFVRIAHKPIDEEERKGHGQNGADGDEDRLKAGADDEQYGAERRSDHDREQAV